MGGAPGRGGGDLKEATVTWLALTVVGLSSPSAAFKVCHWENASSNRKRRPASFCSRALSSWGSITTHVARDTRLGVPSAHRTHAHTERGLPQQSLPSHTCMHARTARGFAARSSSSRSSFEMGCARFFPIIWAALSLLVRDRRWRWMAWTPSLHMTHDTRHVTHHKHVRVNTGS